MLARRRKTVAAQESDEPSVIVNGGGWFQNTLSRLSEPVAPAYQPNEYDDSLETDDLEITEAIVVMTARDRTTEFVDTIQALQGRNIALAVSARDPKKSKSIQAYTEFMLIGKNVGRNIANTYAKLEKLTMLAKRKSIFDDRTVDIQELTYIIKGDLNNLNEQIRQLQEVSKRQKSYTSAKHLQKHSSNVVLALQSKLASMSTDFKHILEVRTENLKQQKSRREQFVQPALPPPVTTGMTSLLLQEQDQVTINLDGNPNSTGPHSTSLIPQSQQQQMSLVYDETDNYLHSRAETMQNIESTIVELGGIFQQLAHMVKEQEEMVERIDTNVQDAELNIEAAHAQILKYFQSVRSNRWLIIKVFAVLIIFCIFFVVFLS